MTQKAEFSAIMADQLSNCSSEVLQCNTNYTRKIYRQSTVKTFLTFQVNYFSLFN